MTTWTTSQDREIAVRQPQRPPVNLLEPLADLDQAWRVAQILAQTTMIPQQCQGSPGNCLVLMMTGQELGLSLNQALRLVYVTKGGQPGLRGELVQAKVRDAGHVVDIKEEDGACTVTITRADSGQSYEGRFTVEQAIQARLLKRAANGNLVSRSRNDEPMPWELYTADMLYWRALARAARRACPEVTLGFSLAGADAVHEEAGGGRAVLPDVQAKAQEPPPQADVAQQVADLDAEMRGADGHPVQDAEIVEDSAAETSAGGSSPPAGSGGPAPVTSHSSTAGAGPEPAAAGRQLRALHTRFTDMGRADKDARRFACSVYVRRWLTSTKQLTADEASEIYRDLGRILQHVQGDKDAAADLLAAEVEQRRAAWEAEDPGQFTQAGLPPAEPDVTP